MSENSKDFDDNGKLIVPEVWKLDDYVMRMVNWDENRLVPQDYEKKAEL
jgi:hypothetical protein